MLPYFVIRPPPQLASLWQVQAVRVATNPNNSRHPAQVVPLAMAEIPQDLTCRRGSGRSDRPQPKVWPGDEIYRGTLGSRRAWAQRLPDVSRARRSAAGST